MKKLFALTTALILTTINITGCATANYSYGNDFAVENIQKIVKGKTTSNDIITYFGEPFSKTVLNESEEKWIYIHSSGSAHAQSFIVTMKVESTGKQKMLDILIKNGVVVNFAFTENKNPYNMATQ